MNDDLTNPAAAMPLTWSLIEAKGWTLTTADPGFDGTVNVDDFRVGRDLRRDQREPLYVCEKRGRGDVRVEQRASSVVALVEAVNAWEAQQR